ncbi:MULTISPECIES: MqnA/MqnD/SBP family protein [Campylobacter]|uniref:Chorismate dehydratase n=2 Tax=Campylobacter TaxID=194 RepID=A0AAX2UL19_9BACT|nr:MULTISPECIES: MqnA/MqnD/SBP family protein [Campylobacter]MDL0107977.1 menaquinone via futalosine step 1 [Campylobacter felis]ARE81158.1 6-amino-6-deoxyfutalosine synthase [Campylobacter helveticus]MCR2055133.1 menaquinone via futalosine step 1 [Campylobacter helveticus]MCR2057407.1 menaquinone via futalosine step 1 [Campylobacter helveticus]MCR2064881.1 menaquinone via futalosine step 1 [Campylobacter helveticus]
MIFGKIDYINLLPLHIYLKKYPLPSGIKASFERKKGVPSRLNRALYKRQIDAAIISSIESVKTKYQNLNLGICANKQVLSVLVEKKTPNQKDSSSASSNALATILQQKGKVVIGDKALKLYLENKENFIDLCEVWHKKTNLPFVFARFSCTQKKALYKKILLPFAKKRIKIPSYILENYAKTREINKKDILFYLEKVIYYKLGKKEKKALAKFTKAVRFKTKFRT